MDVRVRGYDLGLARITAKVSRALELPDEQLLENLLARGRTVVSASWWGSEQVFFIYLIMKHLYSG